MIITAILKPAGWFYCQKECSAIWSGRLLDIFAYEGTFRVFEQAEYTHRLSHQFQAWVTMNISGSVKKMPEPCWTRHHKA